MVWAAIAWIRPTTAPIFSPERASTSIESAMRPVIALARSTMPVAAEICRPISLIEALSSSAAPATEATVAEVSSAAAAALVACTRAPPAIEVSSSAVASRQRDLLPTCSSMALEVPRKDSTWAATWAACRLRSASSTS